MNKLFSLGYHISLASGYVRLFASQRLKLAAISDITAEQYGILYMLTIEDGLYQRQFSKMLVKDRPNVSRMVDILEEKGFVERKQDSECKRKVKVYITQSGREIVKKLEDTKQKITKEISKPLTKEEEKQLLSLLEKIIKNLEDKVTIQT